MVNRNIGNQLKRCECMQVQDVQDISGRSGYSGFQVSRVICVQQLTDPQVDIQAYTTDMDDWADDVRVKALAGSNWQQLHTPVHQSAGNPWKVEVRQCLTWSHCRRWSVSSVQWSPPRLAWIGTLSALVRYSGTLHNVNTSNLQYCQSSFLKETILLPKSSERLCACERSNGALKKQYRKQR